MRINHEGGTSDFVTDGTRLMIDGEPHTFISFGRRTLLVGCRGEMESYTLEIPPTDLEYATIHFGPDCYQISGWKDGRQVDCEIMPERLLTVDGEPCVNVSKRCIGDGYIYESKIEPKPYGRMARITVDDGDIVARGDLQIVPRQAEVRWFVEEPCGSIRLKAHGGQWVTPEVVRDWYEGGEHVRVVKLPSGRHFHVIFISNHLRCYREFRTLPGVTYALISADGVEGIES